MGPSIKLNSVKPEGVTSPGMAEDYAIAPTGNAWLSKNVPGFKNMRAAYRWSAVGFLGFWILIVLLFSREQTTRLKWIVTCSVIFLIISNLPDLGKKLALNISQRDAFFDIERTIVEDMRKVTNKGDRVIFLPYRNDWLVNYLTSRVNIYSYNIGGDKNLSEARKYWPKGMQQFKIGKVDKYFVQRVLKLLVRNEADIIILPYIDMLWAAHNWPAPRKYINEMRAVVAKLKKADFVEIDEREFYAVVHLAKKYNNSTTTHYCIIKRDDTTTKIKCT